MDFASGVACAADHTYTSTKAAASNDSSKRKHCTLCSRTYTRKSHLIRHLNRMHTDHLRKCLPIDIACPFSSCTTSRHNVEHLVTHLKCDHNVNIVVDDLYFVSEEKFKDFVSREQKNINVNFTKPRIEQVQKSGNRTYQLVCHLSGFKKTSYFKYGERKRKRSSCKLDRICTARFYVSVDVYGRTKVKYTRTHSHNLALDQSKPASGRHSIKRKTRTGDQSVAAQRQTVDGLVFVTPLFSNVDLVAPVMPTLCNITPVAPPLYNVAPITPPLYTSNVALVTSAANGQGVGLGNLPSVIEGAEVVLSSSNGTASQPQNPSLQQTEAIQLLDTISRHVQSLPEGRLDELIQHLQKIKEDNDVILFLNTVQHSAPQTVCIVQCANSIPVLDVKRPVTMVSIKHENTDI